MNLAGWKQTGATMVDAFLRKWPRDVELLLYAEDFEPHSNGVTLRKLPSWLDDFKARHKGNLKAHGKLSGRYDYQQDAVKFAHKVAAVTDAGLLQNDGILIWIDADTYTHSPVTKEWLGGLFPEPSYIAWLDRENNYPECGFVMYRCSHPAHRSIMEAFRSLYISDLILKLSQTHDCMALQNVIETMLRAGRIEPPISLSGDKRWHHPFVNGPLGACMDHLKGLIRKQAGRSSKRDIRAARPEPYWR